MKGGKGDDVLKGGSGDDVLMGGQGDDERRSPGEISPNDNASLFEDTLQEGKENLSVGVSPLSTPEDADGILVLQMKGMTYSTVVLEMMLSLEVVEMML